MPSLSPYITFDGKCEDAFNFYKSIFGGEFQAINRFGEMPPNPEMTIPDSEKNKIMHITLPIGKDSLLMGSDTSAAFGQNNVVGNNFSLSVYLETETEAERVFNNLAEGGKITMPLQKTFWNSYFGMLTDQFGMQWMINCNLDTKQQ